MCRSDDDELTGSTGRFMWYKVMSPVLIFHSYTEAPSVSDSGKGSSTAPSAVSSRRSSRIIAESPSMDSMQKYLTHADRSSDLAIPDQDGLQKVKKQGT